jgi:23S rRNA (guanine2069-N7)-methyltransferase / 23S rRNA (guanine2445-N2)-methyltransferase
VKHRHKRRRTEQYSRMDATGRFYEIHEGGLTFLVNLADYLDTGLFLDHRVTREMIRRAARGKRFLNLFAYTATASVYAADGGAKETVSVDSSNTYLRWARENFTANRIGGAQHRLERGDCIEWLTQDSARYDLIFMDPPTFSNAKGKRETLDVQRDHPRLIELALRRLGPGGEIIFSTNFRRFRMELPQRVAAEVEDVTAATIPRDFHRNRRIHHCFRIRKRGDA